MRAKHIDNAHLQKIEHAYKRLSVERADCDEAVRGAAEAQGGRDLAAQCEALLCGLDRMQSSISKFDSLFKREAIQPHHASRYAWKTTLELPTGA